MSGGGGDGADMSRKISYPLPKPSWTCPHCQYVHGAAEVVRIDSERLRCKQCGEAFLAHAALTNG